MNPCCGRRRTRKRSPLSLARALRQTVVALCTSPDKTREDFKQTTSSGNRSGVWSCIPEFLPARRPQIVVVATSCNRIWLRGGAIGPSLVSLKDVTRVIAIGSDGMMRAVKEARHGVLAPFLSPDHIGVASVNSPMQCMMKQVCAQCLQRHVDPVTGRESFVFSCFNQDQPGSRDLSIFEPAAHNPCKKLTTLADRLRRPLLVLQMRRSLRSARDTGSSPPAARLAPDVLRIAPGGTPGAGGEDARPHSASNFERTTLLALRAPPRRVGDAFRAEDRKRYQEISVVGISLMRGGPHPHRPSSPDPAAGAPSRRIASCVFAIG